MSNLQNISTNGADRITAACIDYAKTRKAESHECVGQFLDREGARDNQFGIYGSSIFLTITKDSHDSRIADLRAQCSNKLKHWIELSNKYDLLKRNHDANDKSQNDNANSYELKNVISKICYAYEACHYQSLKNETSILESHLLNAQHSDGSFGFLCTDINRGEKASMLSTALVLRLFFSHNTANSKINDALSYLKQNVIKVNNIFEQLYILNSIQIILNKDSQFLKNGFAKNHDEIRKTLKKLLTEVALNPTSFPNPINVDFNDSGRTRYYRLYSDLILIESLTLAYSTNLHYLRGDLGERALQKLWNCLNGDKQRDTTFHRISFGFFHDMFHLVEKIKSKYDSNLSFFSSLEGKYRRMRLFGIDFRKEGFIILISSPLIAFLIVINIIWQINTVVNTVSAFLLARLANIFGLWYDRKNKDKI
jgi:hypothetical protein